MIVGAVGARIIGGLGATLDLLKDILPRSEMISVVSS
jgi:hypothetical protein